MELTERLAQARKARGLSQADAAERLNVSRQAISRWETGVGTPSLDSLIQMGTAVNRHITSLGTLVVFATAPFNLVKGLFCSLIVLLIYKKLSPLLHR